VQQIPPRRGHRVRPGYLRLLLSNRGFRLVWAGTVVSFLGDWLTTVAVLTIATELSDSALVVSAVMIAKTLPIFLVSPVAGSLADRVDRRLLMIGSDLGRAGLVVAMIACYWARNLELLMAVLTLRTLVAGFFIPARTAAIPDLTDAHELPVAIALSGGTWSVMLAVGAALGGMLTAWVGVTGALALDAVTFLGSAALLWGLPALPPRDETSAGSPGFIDGIRVLKGRVYLPSLLVLKSTLAVSGGVLVLLPLFATEASGRGVPMLPGAEAPLLLGLLYASRGLGALVGSMGVRLAVGDAMRTLQWSIVPAFGILSLMYVGMSYAPNFAVLALCLGVAMVGSGVVWTFSGTLGQLATEREVRGRLFALEFGLTMLVSSLASFGMGGLVDAGVEPRRALLGLAVLSVVPGVLWAAVLLLGPDVQRVRS